MRVLVVTWDGAGNLVSTLGISRHLSRHGHDVRLLGHRSIDERCGNDGWRFRAFVHTVDYDSTAPLDLEAEMALMSEQLWFSRNVANDVCDELEREPADLLLVDAMLIGALCAGEASGVPTVALFHAAFSLFRAGPMVEMLAPALPAVAAIRAQLGLPAVDAMSGVHDRCALNLVAAPREFEPEMPLPPNVTFVGPVLDGPALLPHADEVDVDDGRDPLILVSFSTSDQAQAPVVQRCISALAEIPARVVVTTGPSIDPAAFRAAENTRVVRFVPHADVLPHATLVVTHAGLGTVMAALSHGVPLLCLPLGRDQFFNAAMVERIGAGHSLPGDADVKQITDVVRGMLDDDGTRANAKRMATLIAGYGGGAAAVAELERVAGNGSNQVSERGVVYARQCAR
jgi:MGT family glycosyltransferase